MATQTEDRPAVVWLGNSAPIAPYDGAEAVTHKDGEAPYFEGNITENAHEIIAVRTDDGERDRAVVAVRDFRDIPPSITMVARPAADVENHLYATKAVFGMHSAAAPMWVASDNYAVAQAIAAEFGCPILPADMGALAMEQREQWDRIADQIEGPTALLLNGGRDALFDQHFTTGAQPAAFNYIGLTANSTAPAATDTTLTGQITTAGGGLIAAQATYAHTAGTATATLSKTFTANGSDTLPVTIAKVGVRNASGTSGVLGTATLLSSTATLSASGDALTVTCTFTLTPS